MNDQLQKFMFHTAPVRGAFVTLRNTWQDVLRRHNYPEPLHRVLGEMMAAGALLSANLKFEGTLILQIFGNGPAQMLVVQCSSDFAMRATAKVAGPIAENATLSELVNVDGGGRCAITLDPREKKPGQQPYQGVVPLNGEDGPLTSIAEILEQYMWRSEQLDTRLWLAADREHAVGMLLQKLPGDGGIVPQLGEYDADIWNRVCRLGATLTPGELLFTEPKTLLRRLFWQESIRRFESAPTRFRCTCSREKVSAMLSMLGREEVDEIIAERGSVEIHCEFCNRRYEFDAVDVTQLFVAGNSPAGISHRFGSPHH